MCIGEGIFQRVGIRGCVSEGVYRKVYQRVCITGCIYGVSEGVHRRVYLKREQFGHFVTNHGGVTSIRPMSGKIVGTGSNVCGCDENGDCARKGM